MAAEPEDHSRLSGDMAFRAVQFPGLANVLNAVMDRCVSPVALLPGQKIAPDYKLAPQYGMDTGFFVLVCDSPTLIHDVAPGPDAFDSDSLATVTRDDAQVIVCSRHMTDGQAFQVALYAGRAPFLGTVFIVTTPEHHGAWIRWITDLSGAPRLHIASEGTCLGQPNVNHATFPNQDEVNP